MPPLPPALLPVHTRRFVLRDYEEGDRAAFVAYQGDPRMSAFAERGDGEALFDRFLGWAAERPRQTLQLAVAERDGGGLVGSAGLRWAASPAGEAELGIELAPAHWGRHGVAVEVGRALLDVAFGGLGLAAVTGVTVSANERVARLAGWFGAVPVGTRPAPGSLGERGWVEVELRLRRERWRGSGGGAERTPQPPSSSAEGWTTS
jgi:RimJ/RimL family protein N-acetyltransferase